MNRRIAVLSRKTHLGAARRHALAAVLLVVAACGGGSSSSGPGPSGAGVVPRIDHTLAAGYTHACEIRVDGGLYCWGANAFDQLGTATYRASPKAVRVGADSDWVSVVSGHEHTCARKKDGTARCFGMNGASQAGNRTGDAFTAGPLALDATNTWGQIGAGLQHSCGTRTDGTLYCWGANYNGALGIGDERGTYYIRQVGTDTDWADVAAGDDISCGLKTSHLLLCWGNDIGRIPTPMGTDTDWAEVAVAWKNVCARKTSGAVHCFTPEQPLKAVEGVTDFKKVVVGKEHMCGLRANGALVCWGANGYGQLGQGTTIPAAAPTQVGTDTDWTDVAAGAYRTCARKASGQVLCFGENEYGGVGNGTMGVADEPRRVGTDSDWADVVASSYFTCARKKFGALYCFGRSLGSTMSSGPQADNFSPIPKKVSGPEDFALIVGHAQRIVAIRSTTGGGLTAGGRAFTWGTNLQGTTGSLDARSEPQQIFTGDSTWIDIAAGGFHFCAVRVDGALYCSGANYNGQLGTGLFGSGDRRVGTDSDWVGIATGTDHTLGLKKDGSVYGWGGNNAGQTGATGTPKVEAPKLIEGLSGITRVVANRYSSCAIGGDGSVTCFGNVSHLGLPQSNTGLPPTKLPIALKSISLGYRGCGITTAGKLVCTGAPSFGPMHDGSTSPDALGFSERDPGTDWANVTVGDEHVCAVKTNGELYCMGENWAGQIGSDATLVLLPTPVL